MNLDISIQGAHLRVQGASNFHLISGTASRIAAQQFLHPHEFLLEI